MSNPLQEKGVVPDVLDRLPSINLGLQVAYGNNIVTAGAEIPRNETLKVPTLKITNADSADSSKYTIIMDDPDLFVKNDPTGNVRVSACPPFLEFSLMFFPSTGCKPAL